MKEVNYQNSKILKINFIVNYKSTFINYLAVPFSEKVKFTLEGPEGRRSITLLFLYLNASWGGWSTPRPGRFTPGKEPVPLV
jgi:hypothetical protein